MKNFHGDSSDEWQIKYLKYKNKYLQQKSIKMLGGGSEYGPEIMLFKADWCGHCQDFLPTWEKISKDPNMKISFKTFDSDKNKDDIENYKIKGFPTLLLKADNKVIEYNGSRDEKSIKDFINSYS